MSAPAPLPLFRTTFYNSRNEVVSGTMSSETNGRWVISTVPLWQFKTEAEAVLFYRINCDPETGLPKFI